ncbi:Methylosome subunit pICln [Tyrophagus putrescentiae]|nr:Methylosome subunit pICln [Tyrophagus putrescentiae]
MLVLSPLDELPAPESVVHRTANTTVYLRRPTGEDAQLGVGELVISSTKFTFHTENGLGFSLAYPQISLHAISRDLSNFHSECLYLMFEKDDQQQQQHQDSPADQDNSDNSEATVLPYRQ